MMATATVQAQERNDRATREAIISFTSTATTTPEPIFPTSTATPSPEQLATPSDASKSQQEPWTAIGDISSYCLQGLTRSETWVEPGIAAADPDFIPLGSIVEIEDYGTVVIKDTGSQIRRWRIDIWNSDCNWSKNWGRQERRIRVIE